MASVIPFGQPILIGHPSEQRDRNYRDKIHNTFGKAFAMQDKAAYYEDKAENAQYTASGKKYANPKYLNNRIKECEKNIRILDRRLLGKLYKDSPQREITPEAKCFYNERMAEEKEKLQFYYDTMLAIDPNWVPASQKKSKSQKGQSL